MHLSYFCFNQFRCSVQGLKYWLPGRHLATCSAALVTRVKVAILFEELSMTRIVEGNGLTNAETVAVFFFSGCGLRVYMSAIQNPHRSGLLLDLCFANLR